MTSAEFATWVQTMRDRCGWNRSDCAAALGVFPGQITRWRARGAPRYVGLACRAIREAMERGSPLAGSPPAKNVAPVTRARQSR